MNRLLDPLTKQAFLDEKEAALAKLEKAGWRNVRQLDIAHSISSDELTWHLHQLLDEHGKKVDLSD